MAIALCVFAALAWWLTHDSVVVKTTQTPFRYAFELHNASGDVIRDATLSVFAPMDLVGRQRVLELEANVPYQEITDNWGNRTLAFDLGVLPPFGTKVIVVSGSVEVYSPSHAVRLDDEAAFLGAERFVQTQDAKIRARAAQLAVGEGELAPRLAAYVHRHIENSGYLVEDRGAVFALERSTGDCTEYMSLFAALARANGVPVRNLAGFVVNPRGARLSAGDYHNWNEYYDGRRWILVDAQNDVHDSRHARYLAFRLLTSATQLSNTQRFFSADPRLEVRMK